MCTHSIDDLLPHAPLHCAATGEMVKCSLKYHSICLFIHAVGIAVSSFILITIILLLFTIMMVYHVCIFTRRQKNRYVIITKHRYIFAAFSFKVHDCSVFRMDLSNNVDVDLVKCRAYEVVKLSRQRVTMNENPAYGEIGVRVHSDLS